MEALVSSVENEACQKIKTSLSLCLWRPHRRKGPRHLLKYCRTYHSEERRKLYANRPEGVTRDGLARNNRSRTTPTSALMYMKSAAGRFNQPVSVFNSSICPIKVWDGPATYAEMERCDDSSDESFVSPSLVQTVIVKVIGIMASIAPMKIHVTLKKTGSPATSSFSCTWHVPRLLFKLAARQMALINIIFLVADNDTACEDLLIGLPVLRHLGIGSSTLLQQKWSSLDCTDCAGIGGHPTPNTAGQLGRLIVSQMQRDRDAPLQGKPRDRPRSNYYDNQHTADSFPDPFLINPENDKNENDKHCK